MEKYRFVFFFLSQAVNSRLCLESRPPCETTGFPTLGQFPVEKFSSQSRATYEGAYSYESYHMTSILMGRGGVKDGLSFADSDSEVRNGREIWNSADELCLYVPLK